MKSIGKLEWYLVLGVDGGRLVLVWWWVCCRFSGWLLGKLVEIVETTRNFKLWRKLNHLDAQLGARYSDYFLVSDEVGGSRSVRHTEMLRYCCRFEDFLIAKRFSIRRRGIPTISIIILITHLIIIDSLQYFKVQFRSSHQHHEILYLHDLGFCHRRWRYINRLLFSNFATGTRILISHQVSPSIASTRATPHFLSLITKLDFPSS